MDGEYQNAGGDAYMFSWGYGAKTTTSGHPELTRTIRATQFSRACISEDRAVETARRTSTYIKSVRNSLLQAKRCKLTLFLWGDSTMSVSTNGISPSSTHGAHDPHDVEGSRRWRHDVEGPYRRLDPNPGRLELTRLALCALTLVPLRVLLIALLVSSYYVMSGCWLALTPDRPWAHSVSIYALRMASRLLLLIMGFWHVQVSGRENMGRSDEPRVFVSNHVSYVEIMFFAAVMGPSFVMKRTCLQVPFVGDIATRVLDSLSVDNTGGKEGGSGSYAIAARLQVMFGATALANWQGNVTQCSAAEGKGDNMHGKSALHKELYGTKAEAWARGWRGNPLLVFPEGTTSNGSCLLRFKTGVFSGGMPVYPVAVQYDYRRFSPAFESILTSVHIFRMLAEPANHLRVKFLPRYCPTPEQRVNRAAYAKAVQGILCDAMDLPPAASGYGEKTKYHKYLRRRFQEHPWGNAAFLLPAPDRHDGVTRVTWGDENVFASVPDRANGGDTAGDVATKNN